MFPCHFIFFFFVAHLNRRLLWIHLRHVCEPIAKVSGSSSERCRRGNAIVYNEIGAETVNKNQFSVCSIRLYYAYAVCSICKYAPSESAMEIQTRMTLTLVFLHILFGFDYFFVAHQQLLFYTLLCVMINAGINHKQRVNELFKFW